ncbi:MAG: NTP transferase domain-containing protein [Candidatus Omnitrophota bacterium]|nr:MAG: NTP transferase domain-containing protein [Candidatus Omnitrophota bacterium]
MLKKDILINEGASIKDALKKLDKSAEKVLLVVDEKRHLLGTMTDGDVRRCILTGKHLGDGIGEVYHKKPIHIKKKDFSQEVVKKIIVGKRIALVPIVDEGNKIIDFVTRDELLLEGKIEPLITDKLDIPVVIMAGGEGTRLDPFTRILPKPLIPIDDKPIVEIVIEEFKRQGLSKYYLTLNHKSGMIEAYFDGIDKDYEIKFIRENTFLGTAGSLRLLEKEIGSIFLVSNCDVIVKTDFGEALNFHKEQRALLTILSPIQHYKIPYGVVEFKQGGEVKTIIEKPEYTFTVNAGIYVLSKESLQFMPERSRFDMTDLIRALIEHDKKVVMYPVNECDYIDIGQWDKYQKTVSSLKSRMR